MKHYHEWYICIALFLALFSPSSIEADELSDLKKRVEKQQKEVEELRQSLDELEKGSRVRGEINEAGPMFGNNLGIFGDVDFSTKNREKTHSSFYLGDVDIYSAFSYGERLNFLMELVVEPEDAGFEVDLERLWLGYAISDLLIIRAGKQHTALGYWNKTYHHGKQLFLTVDRPFFLQFEDDGGVLPVHTTGVELEGSLGYQFARLKYELDVGNGPKIDQSTGKLDPNNASDDNNSKEIALRVSARPSALPGLNIGLFGAFFKIDTSTKNDMDEWIYGMDLAYVYSNIELLAEYFRFHNAEAASNAYYVQIGYNIVNNLTPYARFEGLDADKNDPYLRSLKGGFDRRQIIAGVKYDIDIVRSSIKVQYRHDYTPGGSDYNVFEAQWSFGF